MSKVKYETIKNFEEKVISRVEREGLSSDNFPCYAVDPQVIEEIVEVVKIQKNLQTSKLEKVTQTVKRTKKIYQTTKGVLERKKWKPFGGTVNGIPFRTRKNSEEISFQITKKEKEEEKQEISKPKKEIPIPEYKIQKTPYQLALERLPEYLKDPEKYDKILQKEKEEEEKTKKEESEKSKFFRPRREENKFDPGTKKKSVFVRGIPTYLSRDDVSNILYTESQKFGGARYVNVPMKKSEDQNYIAFIDFFNEDDAEKFMNARTAIDGVTLGKNWGRDKV